MDFLSVFFSICDKLIFVANRFCDNINIKIVKWLTQSQGNFFFKQVKNFSWQAVKTTIYFKYIRTIGIFVKSFKINKSKNIHVTRIIFRRIDENIKFQDGRRVCGAFHSVVDLVVIHTQMFLFTSFEISFLFWNSKQILTFTDRRMNII